MSNIFTERAQRVILIAQEEAKRLNHDYVGTEHVLLGLICLGEGVAAQVLANLGVDLRRVRSEVEKIVGTGDNVMLLGEIPFTPRAKKVLEFAVEEATHLGQNYVGTEHLLLGCLREEEGVAARVLQNLGLKLEVVREETLNLLEPKKDQTPAAAKSTCSCHPEPAVGVVTAFIGLLAMYKLPLGDITAIVEAVGDVDIEETKKPRNDRFRELAEQLLKL